MYKETLLNVTDLYDLHYNWHWASEVVLKDIGDKLHKSFNSLPLGDFYDILDE